MGSGRLGRYLNVDNKKGTYKVKRADQNKGAAFAKLCKLDLEREEQNKVSECTHFCLHLSDGHYADAFGPGEDRF